MIENEEITEKEGTEVKLSKKISYRLGNSYYHRSNFRPSEPNNGRIWNRESIKLQNDRS